MRSQKVVDIADEPVRVAQFISGSTHHYYYWILAIGKIG